MKLQRIKNSLLIIAISVGGSAYSQEFTSNESISAQLKNNKVPVLSYRAATSVSPAQSSNRAHSGLAKAIKEGRIEGWKFSTTPPSSSGSSTTPNSNSGTALPSAMSSEEARALMIKENRIAPIVPVLPPVQEEKVKIEKE
jgi:hypothetical protein